MRTRRASAQAVVASGKRSRRAYPLAAGRWPLPPSHTLPVHARRFPRSHSRRCRAATTLARGVQLVGLGLRPVSPRRRSRQDLPSGLWETGAIAHQQPAAQHDGWQRLTPFSIARSHQRISRGDHTPLCNQGHGRQFGPSRPGSPTTRDGVHARSLCPLSLIQQTRPMPRKCDDYACPP